MNSPFEIKGPFVVIALIVLTGIVGGMFIYLGPKATEKSPGILHVGLRYSNEGSMEFLRYGKKGPITRIDFINADGIEVFQQDGLRRGRNLVPIENFETGLYTARISAQDFETEEVPVLIEGRMLNPSKSATYAAHTHVDYNMIGIVMQPTPDSAN